MRESNINQNMGLSKESGSTQILMLMQEMVNFQKLKVL